MKVLFIFLDGVGLGDDNPEINPFSRFPMPHLEELLDGHKLIAASNNNDNNPGGCLVDAKQASLLALDACLGVGGIPQSATGQASLLTGINVPAWLGFHEGPKPTPPIINLLNNGTMLSELKVRGKSAALVNAFPGRYFETIDAGYRLPGVIALSTRQAGFQLKTKADLFNGEAVSADFTGEGWRSYLGFPDTPLLDHRQAGERLSKLAENSDLSIFEYWLTDIAGHHQDMQSAAALLDSLDKVVASLANAWDYNRGLIILTSDHGNLEDLSTRRHTRNNVPLLLIGSEENRKSFLQSKESPQSAQLQHDLTDIAPAILNFIG